MLRFCRKDFIKADGIEVIVAEERISFNQNIWKAAKEYFKSSVYDDASVIRILPVVNEKMETVCYAYQDSEANRELRMLKELGRTTDALQFEMVFPDIRKVIIYGCNELAYYFVKYLECRQIAVSVMGSYWDYVGYKAEIRSDVCDEDTLVVHAEDIFQGAALDKMVIRSVSPEFECVDVIYETNVKMGMIKDAEETFAGLLEKLKEREILILGVSIRAQDTYDLLCEHSIDISAFVRKVGTGSQNASQTLLGKRVVGLDQALVLSKDIIFIDCVGKNSALGNKYVELLDYYGYERNNQMFLINDYTDIPFSNLVHVMYGRRVLLTGDECLCRMLSRYLYLVEEGNVEVKYLRMGEKVSEGEEGIQCLVFPSIQNEVKGVDAANVRWRNRVLSDMKFDNYTEYFIRNRVFALIDRYLNGNGEKYTVPELIPKGILLGRIPPYSGNYFFRGIMDGHPEILMISNYSDLNNNLFYYCIRLAECNSDEILSEFWKLYDTEAASKDVFFTDIVTFERIFKRLIGYKKAYTSQELFVIFHIAYAEMQCGKQIMDVSEMVIYWEPHYISRDEFPFFEAWLEDKKINGQTVRLRRNNMMRTGSSCERAACVDSYPRNIMFSIMFLEEMDSDTVGQRCSRCYWTEHKLRFEDIKVYPKDKLLEICEWLDISWSDSMMKTTSFGKPLAYRGSLDFDLQPVFKKSEDFLSEFDRLRILIACSPYQKRYGYTYQNCMDFSRKELQEMFLKPFYFEEQDIFKFSTADYMKLREQIRWNLWNVRKHMVLDDIPIEFEKFELKQTGWG